MSLAGAQAGTIDLGDDPDERQNDNVLNNQIRNVLNLRSYHNKHQIPFEVKQYLHPRITLGKGCFM